MIQRPSCTVKINGQDEEIFMSFGLLNSITRHVGDPDNISLITLNADLREIILKEMIAKRTPTGKVIEERQIDEIEISLDDIENLLEFAAEHATDFLIRALEKTNARSKQYQERLKALAPSSNGQKA